MGAFVCMVRGAAAVIVCRYRMDSCVRPVSCVRQLHTIAQRAQSFHDKSALCRAFGLCRLAAGGVEMRGVNESSTVATWSKTITPRQRPPDLDYCLRCLLMLVMVHSASARLSQGKPPLAWASLPLSSAARERPLPVRPSPDLT